MPRSTSGAGEIASRARGGKKGTAKPKGRTKASQPASEPAAEVKVTPAMHQGLQTLMLQYMSPKGNPTVKLTRKNVHARTWHAAFRLAKSQKYSEADSKKIASTYSAKMVKYHEQDGVDVE
eukprot:3246124-Karenia_brevis.AAC.1